MKIILQKQDDAYRPYDDEAVALTRRKKDGSKYVVDIVEGRNPEYHRRAFKMLHILYDMVDETIAFTPWRKLLTIKAGFFTAIGKVSIKGTVTSAVIADSLAYEKMDQEKFRECWLAIHQAFCDKYGKLLTMDQLTEWSMM